MHQRLSAWPAPDACLVARLGCSDQSLPQDPAARVEALRIVRREVGFLSFSQAARWPSFRLVLVVANLFKMWPGILTAACTRRLRSDRFQDVYRVLFVEGPTPGAVKG
jgi:hypothetical protein